MSDFKTYAFPYPLAFTFCFVNGYVYLSPLLHHLAIGPPTHSTKLDCREQWQFYIHLYLFIIVSDTCWKFNNLFVQINALNVYIFSMFLKILYSWTPTHEGILWWLGCVTASFVCLLALGASCSSARISGGIMTDPTPGRDLVFHG